MYLFHITINPSPSWLEKDINPKGGEWYEFIVVATTPEVAISYCTTWQTDQGQEPLVECLALYEGDHVGVLCAGSHKVPLFEKRIARMRASTALLTGTTLVCMVLFGLTSAGLFLGLGIISLVAHDLVFHQLKKYLDL